MIVEVNGAIGHSICLDTEDILVVTGSAGMYAQGNEVKYLHYLNYGVSYRKAYIIFVSVVF